MRGVYPWLRERRHILTLLSIIFALTFIPTVAVWSTTGSLWPSAFPTLDDELNFARLHVIGEGHLTDGNGYFLEHADGPPLVLFGGGWLNAVPLWLGLSLTPTLMLNFVIWSLLFAATFYALLRELRVPRWLGVGATIFLYLQSYWHIWRPVNLQPVYPFYFLFYFALVRFMRDPRRRNTIWLALAAGATFYVFAFLWQIVVATLGLLFLYALVRKDWHLMRESFLAGFLGCLIGLPVPLYMFWLSHASPYYWESMNSLGLEHTHLPMSDVITSGGWIGVVCVLLAVLVWRVPALRRDPEFVGIAAAIAITGLGIWIIQGGNLFTGLLLETGGHVRLLMYPWLLMAPLTVAVMLWSRRQMLSLQMRWFSVVVMAALFGMNAYFSYEILSSSAIFPANFNHDSWNKTISYAGPLQWIDAQQQEPVVIWVDPHDDLDRLIPVYSRDFTLYSYWGMFELVPQEEVRERYLVSQYFNNPTLADLESEREMGQYLGRYDYPHHPKTLEKEIKLCKLFYFWEAGHDCGTPQTPQELLGQQFFVDLEQKFASDIQPNIKTYLTKYHVRYILKDKILDPQYHPETIGAKLVYSDQAYEVYKLP